MSCLFCTAENWIQDAPQVIVDLEKSDNSGEPELVHLLYDAGPGVLEHDDVGESRKVPLGIRVGLILKRLNLFHARLVESEEEAPASSTPKWQGRCRSYPRRSRGNPSS